MVSQTLRDKTKCRHSGANDAKNTSKTEGKYNNGQDLSRASQSCNCLMKKN